MPDTILENRTAQVAPPDFSNSTVHVIFGDELDLSETLSEVDSNGSGNWVFCTPPVQPSVADRILSSLDDLSRLRKNWDSYGAPRLNRRIIAAARRMVKQFPSDLHRTPAVVPMSTGTIPLEWDVDSRSLEIELESSGRLHYLKWDPLHDVEEEGIYAIDDMGRTRGLIDWVCGGMSG